MSDKHSKDLRNCILILAAVGVILGLLAGCASTTPKPSAIPVHVIEQGRTVIRLMPGPCVDPYSLAFVSRLEPQIVERLRAIDSTWPMSDGTRRPFAGCWIELTAEEAGGTPAFGLIFEDGQRFTVPKSDLLPGGRV